jgi:uncharacterized protein with GYD domain
MTASAPPEEESMQTFLMTTRLNPGVLQSPRTLEELERRVAERVRQECPDAEWVGSYALLGPYDYLDVFKAPTLDDAFKISTIVRAFGHAQTELWPAVEWDHFKSLVREMPDVPAGIDLV